MYLVVGALSPQEIACMQPEVMVNVVEPECDFLSGLVFLVM